MVEKKRPPKGETISIRLDIKSRFMLDFVARLRGQTLTTVIERSITDTAEHIHVNLENYLPPGEIPDGGSIVNWKYFWSSIQGVRELAIADVDDLYPNYEEKRRLEFAQSHFPFFYSREPDFGSRLFREEYIEVLWSKIDEYVAYHDAHKREDYYAAGKLMAADIAKAGLKPPTWPPAD